MSIFDFIFENKKKNQERLKATNEDIESMHPFTFKSNCHQRYENKIPVMGLQECVRTICVVKNTNGCRGYKLEPGIGYIVKIYNDDLGRPNMSDKPMKVIHKTANTIELRGFPVEAQSPFGWQEVDYSDYGFVVYYKNGHVDKCVLHMYDRNTYIEYRNVLKSSDYSNFLIDSLTKTELESSIKTLSEMSYLFRDSQLLKSTGGGRNVDMMSKLHSYAGILGFYYEEVYHYGRVSEIVDNEIASHYRLVKAAMSNSANKERAINELADNWSDVLHVIHVMQLEPTHDGARFKSIEQDIQEVTSVFEKISRKKCRENF